MESLQKELERLDPASAWKPWEPQAGNPWNRRWLAHLHRRAGFGLSRLEMDAAIEKLPPFDKSMDAVLAVSKTIAPGRDPINSIEVRADWFERMMQGTDLLREKMTLFWHNHFATSMTKVRDSRLMAQQIQTLRKHALGSFRTMLAEISHDPAMLIWLDSNQNIKSHPNENFAREVMELFTLGVGNYHEKDVQEAARAFTGWQVQAPEANKLRQFHFRMEEHDFGEKTVLKQKGNWDGGDILRILLEQPVCALFLMRKLYAFLVNDQHTPPDRLLEPLATAFRKRNYDIAVPVQMILRSSHFFSNFAYRQKVKSPVDYALNIVRMFGVGLTGRVMVSPYILILPLEQMGQNLLVPPNVKGWEGGQSWLNSATILARHNFAYEMVHGMNELNRAAHDLIGKGFLPAVDPLAYIRRLQLEKGSKIIANLEEHVLSGDLRSEVRDKLIHYIDDGRPENFILEQRTRDTLYALLTLPENQLA